MRVIAGSAGGVPLQAPRDVLTRPITDRVKETLFGILGSRVPDARVLDLYAGSGAIGIEALSRGAERRVRRQLPRPAAPVELQGGFQRGEQHAIGAQRARQGMLAASLDRLLPSEQQSCLRPTEQLVSADHRQICAVRQGTRGRALREAFGKLEGPASQIVQQPDAALAGQRGQLGHRRFGETTLTFLERRVPDAREPSE